LLDSPFNTTADTDVALELYSCLLERLKYSYIADNDSLVVLTKLIVEDSRRLRRVPLCSIRRLSATCLVPIELLIVLTKFNLGELIDVLAELYCTLGGIVIAVLPYKIVEY
jgi:hypothetical protein